MKTYPWNIWDCETGPSANARDFIEEPKSARSKSVADQLEDAALSAITGRVLVIGVLWSGKSTPNYYEGEEKDMLEAFWLEYTYSRNVTAPPPWVGFNTNGFDIPFIIRRSIVCGVKPAKLITERGYPMDHLIDLRQIWAAGERGPGVKGSLDVLARLCCIGSKTGNGGEFAALYADEPAKALAYLENDLRLTAALAERML